MAKTNDIVEVLPEHWISNRGIKSIKYNGHNEIVVTYNGGHMEILPTKYITMSGLLSKLGRLPERRVDLGPM